MRLIEDGKDKKEVERIIDEEYRAGKLLSPRKPGVASMFSTEFKKHNHESGKMEMVFPPHVMFYAPHMKKSDIGGRPEHLGSESQPFILNEGKPYALIIVVPKENGK